MRHESDSAADNQKDDLQVGLESNRLSLRNVEQTSSGEIFEITSSDGSVFFIRTSYLQNLKIENIIERVFSSSFPGAEFSEEETEDLIQAGFALSAERKACDYLERCEQSRFGLTQKLLKKGFATKAIELALDWLESKNYLNDLRFSSVWIRSHCLTKFQGRNRLLSELLSRGISKNVASEAIENFFSSDDENIDNPNGITEEVMCEKAYQKGVRQKKSGEKLLKFLMNSGFPYKMALAVMKNHKLNIESDING